jgi:hypothetical protein
MKAGGLALYILIQPTISLEMPVPSQGHYVYVKNTFTSHIDRKNIFNIFVDFLFFKHFHYLKMHRLLSSLQRRNIFRQDLKSLCIYFAEFGTALTTTLPILFQYCYKYCYSDSRNLWAVMKAGGLALSILIQPTISLEM